MYFYFIDTHYIFNEGKISQKVQVFMQVRRTNIKTILFFQKDPGYGAISTNGPETIAAYIKHRMEREAQILGMLSQMDNSGGQYGI